MLDGYVDGYRNELGLTQGLPFIDSIGPPSSDKSDPKQTPFLDCKRIVKFFSPVNVGIFTYFFMTLKNYNHGPTVFAFPLHYGDLIYFRAFADGFLASIPGGLPNVVRESTLELKIGGGFQCTAWALPNVSWAVNLRKCFT